MPCLRPRLNPMLTALYIALLAAPASAQSDPGKVIARPGAMSASALQAKLKDGNTMVARLPPLRPVTGLDRIAAVNGNGHATLEPGGDYRITGKGFGSQGSVLLSTGGHQIVLFTKGWSDGEVYATMPSSTSGLLDGPATLIVMPIGKRVLRSSAFQFRAARADQVLKITPDMVTSDAVLGGVDATIPPSTKIWDGKNMNIERKVDDQGDLNKRCFSPGVDRFHTMAGLKPGFEVTAYYWWNEGVTNSDHNGVQNQARGAYATRWEGDVLVVSYGVQRWHIGKVLTSPARGGCHSLYNVQLIVTGPRGVSPL